MYYHLEAESIDRNKVLYLTDLWRLLLDMAYLSNQNIIISKLPIKAVPFNYLLLLSISISHQPTSQSSTNADVSIVAGNKSARLFSGGVSYLGLTISIAFIAFTSCFPILSSFSMLSNLP